MAFGYDRISDRDRFQQRLFGLGIQPAFRGAQGGKSLKPRAHLPGGNQIIGTKLPYKITTLRPVDEITLHRQRVERGANWRP